MKLTIYLVDDEQIAIKYFEYLLSAIDLDCEVVGKATNSMKAVQEIIRLKPDVVFTDISMPLMDGLEVAEEILKHMSTKIFLLTAYRDFDFIKKGMRLGVTDYILKNELNEESLQTLLKQTADDIMIERREQHRILEYNVRNFLLSQSKILEGYEEQRNSMKRYGLILVLSPPRIHLKYPSEQKMLAADSYELQTLPYPEGCVCNAFTEVSPGEFCGIFCVGAEVTDGQVLFLEAAKQLHKHFEDSKEESICLLSDTIYRFFDLTEKYEELKCLSAYTHTSPHQYLFQASELRKKAVPKGNWKESWDGFLEVMEKKLSEETEEVFTSELIRLLEESHQGVKKWDYEEGLKNMIHLMKVYVQRKQMEPGIVEFALKYKDINEAEKNLLDCIFAIYREQQKTEEKHYSAYVWQAIYFIQRNYQREISIPDIAEEVKVSEGHLRRCFKQELGMKLVDYLTEYRLEKAKELMKKEDGNLGEIWKRTGFTSAQYFSYVFKKKEGILPRDYLKKIRGKS